MYSNEEDYAAENYTAEEPTSPPTTLKDNDSNNHNEVLNEEVGGTSYHPKIPTFTNEPFLFNV